MSKREKVNVDDIIGIVKTEEATDSVEEVRKLRGRETITGKRFSVTQTVLGSGIYDFQAENELCESYDEDAYSKVVKKLNELHEDNQLLHKMNAEAIDFMYDNFDMNRMFTDRELNDICNEQGLELSEKGIKIDQLEKQNEQLKERIEFIFKQIKAFREDCRTAQYFDGASTITQLIKILDVKE